MTPAADDRSLLDELWQSPALGDAALSETMLAALPPAARRYLTHAIAPGAPLAAAVRLRMHGEIKLRGWLPFEAEQVIHRERGMIWNASVRMWGVAIRGFDRVVDGEAMMRWKLLGLVPVTAARGPDITRSAAGRLAAEFCWLPSALCVPGAEWTPLDESRARVALPVQGFRASVDITVDDVGRLRRLELPRWGTPERREFREAPFGGFADAETTFGGHTVPSRLRIGWYPGSDDFAADGEFFRVTVEEATYR